MDLRIREDVALSTDMYERLYMAIVRKKRFEGEVRQGEFIACLFAELKCGTVLSCETCVIR